MVKFIVRARFSPLNLPTFAPLAFTPHCPFWCFAVTEVNIFPCFTKFSAFAALIRRKSTLLIGHRYTETCKSAGDPSSPQVEWEEVSVTPLGGHGGTQSRQAQLWKPHGRGFRAGPGTIAAVWATPQPLDWPLHHDTEHCCAWFYGKLSQKKHLNQQVVLPHANLSSREWGATDSVQILIIWTLSNLCVTVVLIYKESIHRLYSKWIISSRIILTSLPVITMAKRPSKVSAIMM